jgi:integrase
MWIASSTNTSSQSWNVLHCPNIRLYDLRHTAATLALSVGVSPNVVSEQLGHTSAAFTLDVYSHVLPHMQDDAAAKVEAALMGWEIQIYFR